MSALFGGIDVGKFFHVASFVDQNGEVVKQLDFGNNHGGFQLLLSEADQLTLKFQTKPDFAMEATGHYWIPLYEALTNNGHQVEIYNPLKINRFRDFYIQPIKNDQRDAFVIANLLRYGKIEPTILPPREVRILRKLTRFRQQLTQSLSRYKNNVRTLLDEAFPEYQQAPAFSDIFGKTSLAVLERFGTPTAIAKASIADLALLIEEVSKGRLSYPKAVALRSLAVNSVGATTLDEAYRYILRELTLQILYLQSRIERLDGEIEIALYNYGDPLTSIPGIGRILAAIMISEIGDINQFPSANHLAAYAGLIPSTYQSGIFTGSRIGMSKRGVPQLNHAFYAAAVTSIKFNPRMAAYYQKKRQEGKPKKVALIAVARKLVRLVYAMLKHRITFYFPRTPEEVDETTAINKRIFDAT